MSFIEEKTHSDCSYSIKTDWLLLLLSIATRPNALMDIASHRAVTLDLLVSELLNRSSFQSA